MGHIGQSIDDLIRVAGNEQLIDRVAKLPPDPNHKIAVIRDSLRRSDLEKLGMHLPGGLRIAPRWFEEGGVSSDERYKPAVYIDGHPPGSKPPRNPRPPVRPPGRGGSVCVSVGVVACVSVGD